MHDFVEFGLGCYGFHSLTHFTHASMRSIVTLYLFPFVIIFFLYISFHLIFFLSFCGMVFGSAQFLRLFLGEFTFGRNGVSEKGSNEGDEGYPSQAGLGTNHVTHDPNVSSCNWSY